MRYVVACLILLFSCSGDDNAFDCAKGQSLFKSQCSEKTPDEKAVEAMNKDDWDTAQGLLEELIAENPQEYFRYPRLAVVYAIQGGFDLLSAQDLLGKAGDGITDLIGALLPSPVTSSKEEYQAYLDKIGEARDLILMLPDVERKSSDEYFYGGSAGLQLTLYQAAYSVMFMNRFTATPESLEEITVDDAVDILNNLKGAAETSGDISPETAAQITEVLTAIDGMEGADDKEKLENYLATLKTDEKNEE